MADLNPNVVAADFLPEATRRLIRTADALPDQAYAEPSGLPDWTRGHVVAHLALNAEALCGALHGIVEGRRVPMYPSQEARDQDVADLATAGPSLLRTRLLGGCTNLADAIDLIPDDGWDTTIDRVPGGRTFTAGDVPGMRLSEVEIHHADLAAGYDHTSWSAEFTVQLLDAMGSRGAQDTPFVAYATDLDRSWRYGSGGPTVSGSGAALGWWLTGRGSGADLTSDSGVLPQIGTW